MQGYLRKNAEERLIVKKFENCIYSIVSVPTLKPFSAVSSMVTADYLLDPGSDLVFIGPKSSVENITRENP